MTPPHRARGSLDAGTRLDQYEVIALIGAGGMGEVYRARDPRLRRDVAVKLLSGQLRSDPERLRRFEKEARTAGALNHPGLLSVFDFGVHEGSPFLVTELLDGTTLGEKLRGGRLPLRNAIDYGMQIALALASAHDAGVVHRDIKPANLFVTTDGRVKILDFGIAKALEQQAEPASTMTADRNTADGAILGTAGYMAPEQVRGSAVDHRADIFALGVVLYEMLSGAAPFDKPRPIDRALATLNDDPPSLSLARRGIPPTLELIVQRCIERDPAHRFQSARDLAFALQALSVESSAAPRLRDRSRKRAVVIASAALVAGVALVLIGRASVCHPATASARAASGVRFERITHRTGAISRARFAPDGRTIIFSARFDGDDGPKIYSAAPGNRDFRVLVDQESLLLDVSRQGDLALLLRDQGRLRLARVPLAGGTPRVLLDSVADAAWAPDGSLAALILAEDAMRVEYPIGKVILENKATPGTSWRLGPLAISPDGEHLAVVNYNMDGGPDSLEVVDRRGARRTVVPPATTWFLGVGWRPDGREIWFGDAPHGVFAATIDGRQRQVVEIPGEAWIQAIAPDGRALLTLVDRRTRLMLHSRGRAGARDLTWHFSGIPIDLSYDGKLLLIGESGHEERFGSDTYIRSTDGKPAVHLGPGYPLALSPDGAWALVAPEFPATALNLIPTDAGPNRVLPLGPIVELHAAVFLPDGKHVAIGGHESGKPDRIWIVDVAGAAPPRPIGPEGVRLMRAVSPDGRKLVGEVIATKQATVISIGDGSWQPLPELRDEAIRWSADGNSIYVGVMDVWDPTMPLSGGYVATFDLRTRQTTRMPDLPDVDARNNDELFFAAITPDATSYAYGVQHVTATLYIVTGLH